MRIQNEPFIKSRHSKCCRKVRLLWSIWPWWGAFSMLKGCKCGRIWRGRWRSTWHLRIGLLPIGRVWRRRRCLWMCHRWTVRTTMRSSDQNGWICWWWNLRFWPGGRTGSIWRLRRGTEWRCCWVLPWWVCFKWETRSG